MQCSVELPIEYLHLSSKFNFDFIIASTCLEYPQYLEYFLTRKEKRFTILDNGAFETGKSIPDAQYIELAQRLQPNVLIIPDVFKDPEQTLTRYYTFMNIWKYATIENVKLMGVLQANGIRHWANYLAEIYLSDDIEWFGVPYIAGLDRYQLIESHPEWKNVHILGVPHLSEVLALSELSNVTSVDSSLPVKATMEKKTLFNAMGAKSYAKPDETLIDVNLLESNLNQFTSLCTGDCYIKRGE